ncbi:YihY/virulence factor BrkB family protein [bacterium]|nr:YihY/virulence factor BrkB family protein [bacterium]
MKLGLKAAGSVVKETALQWNADQCLRLSAALAYYTVFSLAPLLLIATAIAGFVLGEEAVKGELSKQLSVLLGKQGADAINTLVANANKPVRGIVATVTGIAALLLGATGVFAELKSSLNLIWEARPKLSSGIRAFIRDRLLSFAMVASISFLLLVSLLVNTAISIASTFFGGQFEIPPLVLQTLYTLLSFVLTAFLFALIFKFLPEVDIEWRDVWVGALITALLFTIGRVLIGVYLGSSSLLSAFGASASIVLIMVWAYYSAAIVFFGAEFTEVYSRTHGSRVSHE